MFVSNRLFSETEMRCGADDLGGRRGWLKATGQRGPAGFRGPEVNAFGYWRVDAYGLVISLFYLKYLVVEKSVDKLFVDLCEYIALFTTLLRRRFVFSCFLSPVRQTDMARVSVEALMATGEARPLRRSS